MCLEFSREDCKKSDLVPVTNTQSVMAFLSYINKQLEGDDVTNHPAAMNME